MDIDVHEVAAYREAIDREGFSRDAAFLGAPETVLGFKVRPMTARHLLWLWTMQSPFVCAAPIGDDRAEVVYHVKSFLMVVSRRDPAPRWWSRLWRHRFDRRFKRFENSEFSCSEVIAACREYVSDATQDAPSGKSGKIYYSAAANIANWICHAYHCPLGEGIKMALDLPLKIAFQLMRADLKYNDPKAILFNPSESVLTRELTRMETEAAKRGVN